MPVPPSPPASPTRSKSDDLPHLPGAWIGTEAFEAVEEDLAAAERFFLAFDLAPERCPRRSCRDAMTCFAQAPAGSLHRECLGRPGAHL